MSEHGGNGLWKTIAVGALSIMLGASGEWFFRGRDAVTSEEFTHAVSAIQKQLDDHSEQMGEVKQSLIQLGEDVARLDEHVQVKSLPAPPIEHGVK